MYREDFEARVYTVWVHGTPRVKESTYTTFTFMVAGLRVGVSGVQRVSGVWGFQGCAGIADYELPVVA